MHDAGMAATLKHFPGHGSVLEDTHFDNAVDDRPLDEIRKLDLVPFVAGIDAGADAVMMAHVVYPQVDPDPAGYSKRWIQDILREEMKFRGVVFSDDIGMAAAFSAGGIKARVDAMFRFSRSEEHTSELQSLMRISYAVFCLKQQPTTET